MKYTARHKLKQILIKYKLLSLVSPIYERIYELLVPFSSKYRAHQNQMLNFYSQFIKKGDLCFDVGAHKGNRTAIFLKLGAKVVAVEPQESCVKYLKSKFGEKPNFVLVEKGLAEKEGEFIMSICEEANDISTFSEKWKTGRFSDYKWNKKQLVPVTTLDSLIKEFGLPVFCKIDVEGFEYQVLRGLSQPIKYISCEFAKEFFSDTKKCVDHLVSLGYGNFNYSLGESMNLSTQSWLKAEELFKQLNLESDKLMWGDIYAKY